jgi:hypothetical protein
MKAGESKVVYKPILEPKFIPTKELQEASQFKLTILKNRSNRPQQSMTFNYDIERGVLNEKR